jgi:hypothetical protein
VTASLRHAALLAARERSVLAPVLALLFVLIGVYFYKPNDVGPTWGLTALLTAPIVAWLQIAVGRAEPEAQRLVRVAAAGGRRRAWERDTAAAAVVGALVAVTMLVYPIASRSFDRPVRVGDVSAAALAHAACAAFGIALGRLASPPVTGRAATALMLVLAAVIGSVALSFGPAGTAQAMADGRSVIPSGAACVVLAALLELTAAALERRT